MLCCFLVAKLSNFFCDPMGRSPPGFSVHGISQARILEWLPVFPPGDLPYPGLKLVSPALAGRFFTTEPPGKPLWVLYQDIIHLRKPHCFKCTAQWSFSKQAGLCNHHGDSVLNHSLHPGENPCASSNSLLPSSPATTALLPASMA